MSFSVQRKTINKSWTFVLVLWSWQLAASGSPQEGCDNLCVAEHVIHVLHPELGGDVDLYLNSRFRLFPISNLGRYSFVVRKVIEERDIDFVTGTVPNEKLRSLYPPLLTATFDFAISPGVIAQM